MPQTRPRCLVLGLDGLPLSLAASLAQSGKLPNLRRLVEHKNTTTVEAELPELSPVNWTSFATAQNPGVHGVFGFTAIDPASYALSLTDASQVACPTIFDRLSAKGLTSLVVNLPHAYPVGPLKGACVSGFVVPEPSKAVQPPFLANLLKNMDYRFEADTSRGAADPDRLLTQLRQTIASRQALFDLFSRDRDFDLFVLVLTETDRILHFFFPALAEPDHPLRAAFLDLLGLWDKLIGKFLGLFNDLPEPKRLLVLADHGFAALTAEVDLNAWLIEQGLLRLGPPREGPEAEWDSRRIQPHHSAAFALDPGRIYIHTKERFARGVFHQYVAESLRHELREKLLALTFKGQPVIEAAHFPEELYRGPQTKNAPDLIVTARPGFCLTGKFNRENVFAPPEQYGRFGCHAPHGAIFHDSLGERPKSVRHVGAAVLNFLGANPANDPPEPNRPGLILSAR